MLVVIADQKVGAFLGEGNGHRPADAAVSTGNDGYAVFQLAGDKIAPLATAGLRMHFALSSGLARLFLGG